MVDPLGQALISATARAPIRIPPGWILHRWFSGGAEIPPVAL
jgi:hypothetical protein